MGKITPKLSQLKSRLESAAFLVSKEGAAKEALTEIVQSLVILSELESIYSVPEISRLSIEYDAQEINKVQRRLPLWAKRQNQTNSKILNAYLKLERSGVSVITVNDLKDELPDVKTFDSNFIQMKLIASSNHGKVFDQYGDNVCLWSPVISYIREYEKVVFESK